MKSSYYNTCILHCSLWTLEPSFVNSFFNGHSNGRRNVFPTGRSRPCSTILDPMRINASQIYIYKLYQQYWTATSRNDRLILRLHHGIGEGLLPQQSFLRSWSFPSSNRPLDNIQWDFPPDHILNLPVFSRNTLQKKGPAGDLSFQTGQTKSSLGFFFWSGWNA